jgi:tetratricopeptide (TPR) repeat protein
MGFHNLGGHVGARVALASLVFNRMNESSGPALNAPQRHDEMIYPTAMKPIPALRQRLGTFVLVVAMTLPFGLGAASQTTAPDAAGVKVEADTNAAAAFRSYVQLQEQLHAAQLAIERNRLEAEGAATRNAELMTERLQTLERTLSAQRGRELEQLAGANRLMLIIGGACAAVGFLAMLLTAYFQWRAVGRLTEFSVLSQASFTLGRGALPAPGGDSGSGVADQASARLFGTLDRLEKRILELEHSAHLPLEEAPVHTTTETATTSAASLASPNDRLNVLTAKGQSLLSLDKIEEAVACFDEILTLDPKHAETLVKKGEALERLRRADEAVRCYDAAINADASLTIAYLHKGGLFNRMERYEEALKCYEQALRTQEKIPAT